MLTSAGTTAPSDSLTRSPGTLACFDAVLGLEEEGDHLLGPALIEHDSDPFELAEMVRVMGKSS